ncbi:AAA family ATPase [Candidatus Aerophobetes bacterium]|nr:AAA family ATPase [Candidatus Aerophobetes bacterium]
MKYKSLLKMVNALPGFPVYRNSTPVITLNGTSLNIEDVVKAALLSELNILLIGERGEGKTQLMQDINGCLFGGKGTYIRARPDMKTKELYELFNLNTLKKELSPKVKISLTQIDEINRTPPIIQNEFFHMCDGYIEYEGKSVSLGEGFHVTVASANVKNERYGGTFEMDDAILDRFSLVVNIDHYPTQTKDDLEIMTSPGGKNPKLTRVEEKDWTANIKDICSHLKTMREEKFDLDAYVALLYLKRGLDWCLIKKSKRFISYAIPTVCKQRNCPRLKEEDCGYIRPLSERAVEAVAALAPSLRLIADAKKGKGEGTVTYREILESFRLVTPYAGILDLVWVRNSHFSNPNFALDKIVERVNSKFLEKKEEAKVAVNFALKGKLDDRIKERFAEEWSFFLELLDEIDSLGKKYPRLLEYVQDEEVIHKYPFMRALK